MRLKVFSKRHPEEGKEVSLSRATRQRIWYFIQECDPLCRPDDAYGRDLCYNELDDRLRKEHGWSELRAYKSGGGWESVNTQNFVLGGVPRFVMDACELYFDILVANKTTNRHRLTDPNGYQTSLNVIFEDANLPWRMLEGRIVKLDSKWIETEILAKAAELISVKGFEGALSEFQQARTDLSSGDYKGAIHAANLALESTIKVILGLGHEKPGTLIRKLIDSKLVPEYYSGFLKVFEQDILRCVSVPRNFEPGVGHGQGGAVSEPPRSLAELVVHLSGVLILYLLKLHLERHPQDESIPVASGSDDEDLPF